jgi:hypothetical protein
MAAAGVGLADTLCRYHVQYKARHGSPWCPSIKASELRPYLAAARAVIRQNANDPIMAMTLGALRGFLDASGRVEPAMNIKHRSAAFRARVAFARLREAGVQADRLLAIHMAVSAHIEDDAGSHREEEHYHLVQVAKAAHRLASGTHRRWEWPGGGTIVMHVYPKSSGLVLRVMGRALDDICSTVTPRLLQAVRDTKVATSGPHPSRLPGWRPHWARRRLKLAAK